MKTIKFGKCPIGNHKGERWSKLEKLDTSKPVILKSVIPVSMGETILDFVRRDTFPDWSWDDWGKLMLKFYGLENPCLLILYFKQGDYEFTTARGYEWRKHKYYLESIGQEFMVVET